MKINSLLRFLIVASFVACLTLSANAQTPDVLEGLTPYGSFHGGEFDSVNLSNGNVLLRIPLLDYPQRGGALKLGFSFVDNSKIASASEYCTPNNGGCYYQWYVHTSQYGVEVVPTVFDQIVDDQVASSVQTQYTLPHNQGQVAFYATVSSDGATHPMIYEGNESLDSTGFYANYSGLTNPTVIINRNGIRFNFPASGPQTREDANGNQISVSSGTYTDTIGRVIPSPASTTNFSACPTGALPISSASLWTVPGPNGGTVTLEFCYVTVNVNIPANEPSPVRGASGPKSLVQSIVLPNGTAWSFEYNDRNPGDPSSVNFGIPTTITLPTGGTITYTFTTYQVGSSWSRWVTSRTINANDGTGSHEWTYAYTGLGVSPVTTVTDPLGNQTVHTFAGGFETETQIYQLINGVQTIQKTVQTSYTQLNSGNGEYAVPAALPYQVTTTWPNKQVSMTETDYDSQTTPSGEAWSYGDLLTKKEYDYGSAPHGALLRTTTKQYEALNSANAQYYLANNLLDLPLSVQITDGGGTQRANTTYGYDEYALQTSGLGSSQQLDLKPSRRRLPRQPDFRSSLAQRQRNRDHQLQHFSKQRLSRKLFHLQKQWHSL